MNIRIIVLTLKLHLIKCKKVVWTLKKGENKIWILFIKAGE